MKIVQFVLAFTPAVLVAGDSKPLCGDGVEDTPRLTPSMGPTPGVTTLAPFTPVPSTPAPTTPMPTTPAPTTSAPTPAPTPAPTSKPGVKLYNTATGASRTVEDIVYGNCVTFQPCLGATAKEIRWNKGLGSYPTTISFFTGVRCTGTWQRYIATYEQWIPPQQATTYMSFIMTNSEAAVVPSDIKSHASLC